MITIIVCIILGGFLFYIFTDEDRILTSSIGGALGAMVGLMLAMALLEIVEAEYKVMESYNIVSLQDNNGIHGSFFLGIGSINDKMRYTFYYEKEEGLYKMRQLNPSQVSIKYTDKNPRVEELGRVPIKSFMKKFTLVNCKVCRKYIIYVPRGSIKNNYNLDAQ